MKILLTIILAAAAISPVYSQDMERAKDELKKSDALYQKGMKEYAIVGGAFLMVHEDKVIDHQTFGSAHLANKIAVDKDTIFHWASITKTLTGIAIMQLRDRGRLKLDDPITKYVPELRAVHNPFGSMDEITIGQLMSHTAGFRGGTWPFGGDKDWHPAEPTKWSQIVAMMPYTEILFKPGSKYSYSNPGVVYLGQVIERLSGEDFEVYMDKNVLRPLDMRNSYYDTTPNHLLQHRSHSYSIAQDGKMTEGAFDMDTGITVSNGGLNAPLTDMAKYLKFLIGDAKRQADYDAILKRSSLEEMFAPVIEVLDEPKNGQSRKDFIGRSFFIEDNFGQRFIGHSGHQNNFALHLYYSPASRAAYIIAFNTHRNGTIADPKATTDRLDLELKEYLFQSVFPALKRKAPSF